MKYPYPWYARVWPLSRIFFAGFEHGEESGIMRGRFQMGDFDVYAPVPANNQSTGDAS